MRKQHAYTEEDLLKGFNEGNEDCFEQVFHSFFPALCLFALRITNNQPTAEDIAEEALIKLWGKQLSFAHFRSLKSYLYAIVRNASINWLHQQQRQCISEKEMQGIADMHEPSIMENMVRAEVMRDVLEAFETLPEQCRKVMRLFFFEGKNTDQIAQSLQVARGTVRTQKARGLALLRQKLAQIKMLFFFL